MGTLTRIAVAAAVAAVAAVAGVLLLGRDAPLNGLSPAAALRVSASFEPAAVQFGDRVVARVVVLADGGAVDVSRLRVVEGVSPLSQLGPAQVTRTTRGRLLVATYEVPAACLTEQCLAASGPARLHLPAARVTAPRRAGGAEQAVAAWPVLEVRGRVTAADLAPSSPGFRRDLTPPAVGYRIAPGTLALLLDAAASLLAVAGVAFAAWQAVVVVRRRRALDTRSELTRALDLLREAESRPPADRRRAVGLLARLLQPRDGRLADEADTVAWSEPAPSPDALERLAEQVSREVGP